MSLLFEDFSIYLSSRAVDEDEDYEGDETITEVISAPVVRWSAKARREMESSGGHIQCSSLLVAIGTAATGFLDVHLLSTQPSEIIGAICCGMRDHEANTLSQQAHTDHTCFVHRLVGHPGVIAVQCKVDVATGQLFSWTEQIFSRLCAASTTVTVLSTSSITEYRSPLPPNDLPPNFLRSLKTCAVPEPLAAPPLEQPNIVSGLPAQIVTYCQVHQFPCVLYICYTDLSCLRSETMKSFRGLLSSSAFKGFILSNPNADKEMTKLCDAHGKHTMLYT